MDSRVPFYVEDVSHRDWICVRESEGTVVAGVSIGDRCCIIL